LKFAARLKTEMKKRGVITRTRPAVGVHPAPGDILFFAPPLIVTASDIDRLVEAARDAVDVVLATLRA
jgi:adenosylmethionine-8-amino-7-oxononanoate aminotransferase